MPNRVPEVPNYRGAEGLCVGNRSYGFWEMPCIWQPYGIHIGLQGATIFLALASVCMPLYATEIHGAFGQDAKRALAHKGHFKG